ncbi:hypothetical protein PR048_031355 [Dryococelus australis]|uniref:Uncharacterized protein n=1 Tax=Dryococelus australis TaxID=614101 RepID=A0ABQ9G842_9NEOP|nr:hypothetical protein PR048_031355 [Dryococelus australis]
MIDSPASRPAFILTLKMTDSSLTQPAVILLELPNRQLVVGEHLTAPVGHGVQATKSSGGSLVSRQKRSGFESRRGDPDSRIRRVTLVGTLHFLTPSSRRHPVHASSFNSGRVLTNKLQGLRLHWRGFLVLWFWSSARVPTTGSDSKWGRSGLVDRTIAIGAAVSKWIDIYQMGPQWPSGLRDSKWGRSGSTDRAIPNGATVAQWIELYNVGPQWPTVSLLASYQGELGLIPGRVTGFSQVGIVQYDTIDRRVSSGVFLYPVLTFRRRSILISITLVGSQDLVEQKVKHQCSREVDACTNHSRTIASHLFARSSALFLRQVYSAFLFARLVRRHQLEPLYPLLTQKYGNQLTSGKCRRSLLFPRAENIGVSSTFPCDSCRNRGRLLIGCSIFPLCLFGVVGVHVNQTTRQKRKCRNGYTGDAVLVACAVVARASPQGRWFVRPGPVTSRPGSIALGRFKNASYSYFIYSSFHSLSPRLSLGEGGGRERGGRGGGDSFPGPVASAQAINGIVSECLELVNGKGRLLSAILSNKSGRGRLSRQDRRSDRFAAMNLRRKYKMFGCKSLGWEADSCLIHQGATVAERLARPPPTKANRVQSPAGSPDFRMWGSCRTMPLDSGFSRGISHLPRPFHFGAAPY